MPILAVDKMGRIYQTSPDREDGLGFGYAPECVDQQDVTLGSAYLKAQAQRRNELIKLHRDNQNEDAYEAAMGRQAEMKRQQKARRARAEAHMYENPTLVDAITKRAHAQAMEGMGCACEYSTAMSGNVMTANGQSGWAGMSRDQQAIHNAVNGIGRDVAHAVDPVEAEQLAQKLNAERILRLKARR